MFKHEHHNKIAHLLNSFDADLLKKNQCLFAGGTAIALLCNEYRESVDVDFLCSSNDGYRAIRTLVYDGIGFSRLFSTPVKAVGDVRSDQYGIRGRIDVDGSVIRLEFVREGRLDLSEGERSVCGVPTLSRDDLFACKLLANTDRGLDMQRGAKDIIDLAMMQHFWGEIPDEAKEKAFNAYGPSVFKAYDQARNMLNDKAKFDNFMKNLKIEPEDQKIIVSILDLDFPIKGYDLEY